MPVDIRAFLDYVKDGTEDGTNAFVHRIPQKVIELNQDKGFVRRGMTLEQKMTDKYDDGLDKGIRGTIEILRKIGRTDQEIMEDITDQYQLTRTEAEMYLK